MAEQRGSRSAGAENQRGPAGFHAAVPFTHYVSLRLSLMQLTTSSCHLDFMGVPSSPQGERKALETPSFETVHLA